MNLQPQPEASIAHIFTGQIAFVQEKGVKSYSIQEVTPRILTKQEIFPQHRKMMMDSYRHYVQQYANMCSMLNKDVNTYNNRVRAYIFENDCKNKAISATENFNYEIGKVSIREYNEAAKIYNENEGSLLIELEKHVPIKKPTEAVFAMIVFKYSMQINEKNSILERCSAPTTRGIQRVRINPFELANTTINDIHTLPYSKRTIQNHINRLVDAGVLFDYTFKGTNKPVEYHVNNEILAIFDHKTAKTLNFDNQLFTLLGGKKLHHNDIVTRANKNKRKITEIVSNQFPRKEVSQSFVPHDDQSQKNKSTNLPIAEKDSPGREKSNKNSEFLRNMTSPVPKLMQDLTNGAFDSYRFDLRKRLEHEVLQGNMNKEEFRDLLLQVFCMMAAPIWKKKEVYMGVWYKAFQTIEDEFILTSNGSVPSKNVSLYYFDNLIFRLTWSKRFFRTFEDFNPLFPSDYFDPTRNTKKSGGFAYTINALKKQQSYDDVRRKRKEQRQKEALPRNANYKAIELIENKIKDLKNGKTTVNELHDYVANNAHIPKEIAIKLPIYIQRAYKC